jgi:tetratricopeptide (TPR) repeat protein
MVDNHWPDDTSRCHRVLGDLDLELGSYESAREHYESALKIARSISIQFVLIEALLARGRFLAKVSQTSEISKISGGSQAFSDLNEALGYCLEGGYRRYEADVRVALAWAYLAISDQQSAISNKEKAKASAERALQMSNEMGYHWGKVDAGEVIERIENRD